jgi:fused signal recognition particle receptor
VASPGWLDRLKGAMTKSREGMSTSIREAFGRGDPGSEEFWEGIEEALIAADCGMDATMALVDELREKVRGSESDETGLRGAMAELIAERLAAAVPALEEPAPLTAIIVGVNGSGKTTTIAKLAQRSVEQGRSVLIGAADTFRAAATEQLEVWAERTGVPMIKQERGADPAAVAFDAVAAANARKVDRLFVDTAGRLHTYVNLMEELRKVRRVAERESNARVVTVLVLDANTGQNGIAQARLFDEAMSIDGVVLTKLDGTAKGGIVLAIANELEVPVWYVGVGERAEDLMPFEADAFAEALVGGA